MWAALEGLDVGGRYEIQGHLASGGMAVVMRGWDHRLNRPVAIKVLRLLDSAADADIERFRREARAAAALQSPHIVEVYDFLQEQGCYYLIMELIEGVNLKERIAALGPLPPRETLTIASQVCYALQAAHDRDFIHRDVKPQNILISPSGLAKLTDFGIVHIPRAAGFTTNGMVLGTADYISPEQAQGFPLDSTTDVYSLGVVLFEMLTGVLPFTGPTPIAVALQHTTAPAPSVRDLNEDIPAEVDEVVQRALRKDPRERYLSARELAGAIEQALASHSVNAAEPVDTQPAQGATEQGWRVLADRLYLPLQDSDRQTGIYEREDATALSWMPAKVMRNNTSVHAAPFAAMPQSTRRLLTALICILFLVAAIVFLRHLV